MDFNTKQQICEVIDAYGEWVKEYIAKGWQAYIVTFMFKPLRGENRYSFVRRMKQSVEIFYSTLVTRVVRYNRSRALQHLLPRLIAAPDLPVFKHAKQSIGDVCINEGVHFHAIVLIPKVSRLKTILAEHVRDKYDTYVHKKGRVAKIDVEPISDTPRRATGYVLKAVKNGVMPVDEILVLPKAMSELGKKKKRRASAKRRDIKRSRYGTRPKTPFARKSEPFASCLIYYCTDRRTNLTALATAYFANSQSKESFNEKAFRRHAY